MPSPWFTSDDHFHHTNVIKYDDRPFRASDGSLDINYMNRELIRRWNERVAPRDIVYHLGDFAMGQRHLLAPTRAKLNGYIILVKGNHDRSDTAMKEAGFDEVHKELFLTLDGIRLYLHHQPMARKYWEDKADYHLCGHVHTAWSRRDNIINVGVPVRDYKPWGLQELIADTEERKGFAHHPEDDMVY